MCEIYPLLCSDESEAFGNEIGTDALPPMRNDNEDWVKDEIQHPAYPPGRKRLCHQNVHQIMCVCVFVFVEKLGERGRERERECVAHFAPFLPFHSTFDIISVR